MKRSWIAPAAWTLFTTLLVVAALYALVRVIDKDEVLGVHVALPEMQWMNTSVSSYGRVVPVEDFQARAAFAGTVEKVLVHVGDKVTAGQLLITMYDPYAPSRYTSAVAALKGAEVGDENIRHNGSQEDLLNLRGDLHRAEMEKADAQKQLSLLQLLSRTGASSEGEISNAEHRLAAANEVVDTLRTRMADRYSKSEVAASRSRIEDAKASLQTAKLVLANANVTSTIKGTVYSLPVRAYDFVPMGAELMRVADLSKVQVHAFIDEPDIGQLAMNQPVTVAWDANPGKIWHGHIKQVPLTVSSRDARVVGECVVEMDDADGTLLPNTNVTTEVITSKPVRVLTIPHTALHMDGPASYVFRVVDDKLARTRVQIGIVKPDRVEIVSGLSERDTVVASTTSSREPVDGLTVKVVP